MLVSIVISFRNEEKSIPLLMKSCSKDLKNWQYEIIFVNDDSSDNSVVAIEEAAREYPQFQIKIITMSRRFGVEECFLAGIGEAKGEAVVLMYADLQDPPELINEMIDQYRNGSEIVHAVRKKRIGEKTSKKIIAFIAYRIINKFAEINIPLDSGEFKLISRRVAEHLLQLKETDPYLRGLITWVGFKQSYVKYDLLPRQAGASKVPLFGKKAWTVFLSGITSFSSLPVSIILIGGFFSSILFMFINIAVVILFIAGIKTPLWLFLTCFFTMLWAFTIFSIGIVAIFVLRIYKDVRGRPQYIIKEIKSYNYSK
jgi:polyisoprenyl-phosphate glycosyltransferase